LPQLECFECKAEVSGADDAALAEAFVVHARAEHEWPFPDQGIRNYAEATQRLAELGERLESIGTVEVHRVTEERLDDWATFFDRDAFAGKPEWAACYCLEPHVSVPGGDYGDPPHWSANRAGMIERLRAGRSFGYLAYADGRVAGWTNASKRSDYTLYRLEGGPPADEVIGVSCFIIAPPFRRHGIAAALLDRVIADAAGRGAQWIEGYPFNNPEADDAGNFRGPRSMYEERGFEPVETRERDTIMRRPASRA
jgi:GNAT superfamily N-acetyltransferase